MWQADAFLQGRAEIPYPVSEGPYRNDYFQDVLPVAPGRAQIPFPPLPAIVLLPFVAVWGLGTNGAAVAAGLGAVNVVLCWLMLLGVTPRRSAALLGTLFYGFGTVAWYAAMLGTTWFLAHVVASTFLFIAIAALPSAPSACARRAGSPASAAGLAFGLAATGAPDDDLRRALLRLRGRRAARGCVARSRPASARSSRCCCCWATTWSRPVLSSTRPTSTSTRSSTGRGRSW